MEEERQKRFDGAVAKRLAALREEAQHQVESGTAAARKLTATARDGAVAARFAGLREEAQHQVATGSAAARKLTATARARAEEKRHGRPGADNDVTDPGAFTDLIDTLADLEYAVALGCSTVLLGSYIASNTSDEKRRAKMDEVVERQRVLVEASTGLEDLSDGDLRGLLLAIAAGWDHSDRVKYLIDLDFSDPFSPYSLKYSHGLHTGAIRTIAALLAQDPALVDEINEARDEAEKAHRDIHYGRIILITGATAAAMAVMGWLAAPVIGTALGTAAGLSGAAATAHGLALLGGGALATGGAGMAGGVWLVTGVGAAAGLISGGGGTALYQLGVAQAESELVKLQVTFKMSILEDQMEDLKAQEVIGSLQDQLAQLQDHLEEEHRLNDENAHRVKDLVKKIEFVEQTIEWMQEQEAAA